MHAAHTLLWTSPSSRSPPPPTLKGSTTPSLKVCLESWPPNLTSLQRCVFEDKTEWGAHCSSTGRGFQHSGSGCGWTRVRLGEGPAAGALEVGVCGFPGTRSSQHVEPHVPRDQGFCGSQIWAQLSCVPCSRSQAEVEVSVSAFSSRGSTRGGLASRLIQSHFLVVVGLRARLPASCWLEATFSS